MFMCLTKLTCRRDWVDITWSCTVDIFGIEQLLNIQLLFGNFKGHLESCHRRKTLGCIQVKFLWNGCMKNVKKGKTIAPARSEIVDLQAVTFGETANPSFQLLFNAADRLRCDQLLTVEAESDQPYQSERQLWTSIIDVIARYVDHSYAVLLQWAERFVYVADVMNTHSAPLGFLQWKKIARKKGGKRREDENKKMFCDIFSELKVQRHAVLTHVFLVGEHFE